MFIKKERKKPLSLLTIYFLVTALWDLELDKQMDFTEGIRHDARLCVYVLVSVFIWQIDFIQTAVLVLEGSEGTASLGFSLLQGAPPWWNVGLQDSREFLVFSSQTHDPVSFSGL